MLSVIIHPFYGLENKFPYQIIKRYVTVISSDPPFKDGNA